MPSYTFTDTAGKPWTIDAPDGVSEAQAFERFQAAQWKTKLDAARLQLSDPTEGMSTFDKLAANVGAGMTNLVQGGAQFVGAKEPGSFLGIDYDPTTAGVNAKRARDAQLADSVTGGHLAQIAGEVAPTLVIPAGGFAKGAQIGAQTLGNLARVVMGGAARPLALAAGRVPAALDAAAAGGLTGALQPVGEGQSRALDAAIGAGTGGVLPYAVGTLGKLASLLTRGGADDRAAQALVGAMGGDQAAQDAVFAARGYGFGPPATRNVPMTTAEVTGDPALFRLQKTAQAQNTPAWVPFREAQARERYDVLQQATAGADDLAARETARDAATAPLRDAALAAAAKDKWAYVPVSERVSSLMQGEARADPNTRKVASYVNGVLDSGATPDVLYRMRKVLVDTLNGPSQLGDDLSAAVKASRKDTMSIVNSIDDALDSASGGKWSRYLTKYGKLSEPVTDARASQLLRENYERAGAPQLGGVPEVTGANLGRAIDKYGSNDFGDTFAADTRRRLQALQENLGLSEGPQKALQKTGTGGGGSNTYMDLFAGGLPDASSALSRTLAARVPGVGALLQRADNLTKAAVNDALMRPDLFISGVSKRLSLSQPLTPTQDAVMRLLRSVNVGAPLSLLPQQ
jgi:hypothetical protein